MADTRDPRKTSHSTASNVIVAAATYAAATYAAPQMDETTKAAIALGVQQALAAFGSALRDAQFFDPDRNPQGSARDVLSTLGARLLG